VQGPLTCFICCGSEETGRRLEKALLACSEALRASIAGIGL
jgi:hypothetical protein